MTLSEPFVVKRVEAATGPWQVLAGGDMTAGSAVFGEALLPARTAGPSLHVHTHEDEAAYVIEGTLTCVVGERTVEADAGTLVWLPRGVPHTFANFRDEPARVFGVTVPAGLEAMFEEQARYFADLDGPPDESVMAEIGAKYGVSIVGPPLSPA